MAIFFSWIYFRNRVYYYRIVAIRVLCKQFRELQQAVRLHRNTDCNYALDLYQFADIAFGLRPECQHTQC